MDMTNKIPDSKTFTIYFKTLKGETYTLEVEPANNIEEIKLKIQKVIGLPADQQRLILETTRRTRRTLKQLEDGRTLRDYQVGEFSTLHVVLRTKGGGVEVWFFKK